MCKLFASVCMPPQDSAINTVVRPASKGARKRWFKYFFATWTLCCRATFGRSVGRSVQPAYLIPGIRFCFANATNHQAGARTYAKYMLIRTNHTSHSHSHFLHASTHESTHALFACPREITNIVPMCVHLSGCVKLYVDLTDCCARLYMRCALLSLSSVRLCHLRVCARGRFSFGVAWWLVLAR